MADGKFIAYYRVSTQKQGQSGLGLDAQREAVASFLNGGKWELVGEFQEVETGKGSDALVKRPQLRAALEACKKLGATLVIAKLDRLARNVHFVSGLMESKVRFVACDMPEANELTIHIMAAFAEHEAKRISQRTKDAIAAKRAKVEAGEDKSGKTEWSEVWGVAGPANLKANVEQRQQAANAFAEGLAVTLKGYKQMGLTQRQIAEELNKTGVKTAKGGEWTQTQVQRVMVRLGQ